MYTFFALALMSFALQVYSSPQVSSQSPSLESDLFTRTEFPSTTVCNTISGTLSTPLASVPLSHFTSRPTSVSTTTATIPITETVTEPAGPYTATIVSWFTTNPTYTYDTLTSTIYSSVTTTLGTATSTTTVCSNPAPSVTTTTYTGTYSNPNPPSGSIFPIEVDCTTLLSTVFTVYETITSGTSTIIINPTPLPPPVAYSTITSTQTIFSYVTLGLITITTTQTYRTAAATATTVTNSECPETSTLTYAAACAPTNLIGYVEVNGMMAEIDEWENGPDTGTALTAGNDTSACCQLCLDSEGCASSVSDPDAGNCELVFADVAAGATCGEIGVIYGPGPNEGVGGAPGNGFVVQAGCGIVEPNVS